MFIPKHCLGDLSKIKGITTGPKTEIVIPKINRINPSKDQQQIDLLVQCLYNRKKSYSHEIYTDILKILKNNLLGSKIIRNALLNYIFSNESIIFGLEPFTKLMKEVNDDSSSIQYLILLNSKVKEFHSIFNKRHKQKIIMTPKDKILIQRSFESLIEKARDWTIDPVFNEEIYQPLEGFLNNARIYAFTDFEDDASLLAANFSYERYKSGFNCFIDSTISRHFITFGKNNEILREFVLTEVQNQIESKSLSRGRKLFSLKSIIKKANIPFQLTY